MILKYPMMGWKFFYDATLNNFLREKMMQSKTVLTELETVNSSDTQKPWTMEEFEDLLKQKGTSYHIYHPFHVMMAEGKLSKEQLQGWVANRFYYQISIPVKDAAILSNCPHPEIRKEWIQRI